MTDTPGQPFYIDSYLVQPDRNRILKNDEMIQVEPRVMDVLRYFAAHPGEVLSRESILNAVWGDSYVEEIALTRTVSELRKIFDDNPRDPRIIETIHKRGYRLIADVHTEPPSQQTEPGIGQAEDRFPVAYQSYGKRTIFTLGTLAGILLVAVLLLLYSFSSSPGDSEITVSHGTALKGHEFDPGLSPDGSRLVFAWRPQGESASDIYVKSLNAGVASNLRLTNSPFVERQPAWSPEGNQIAFVRYDNQTSSIYIIPSVGGTERKIVQTGGARFPRLAWTPDGQWLAYADRIPNQSQKRIILVHIDTREQKEITLPPSRHYGDFHPTFSPDGSKIAFIRGQAKGIHDIFVMDRDNQSISRVTFDHKRIGGLAFSEDGREIIFSSDRGGTFSLWSVPAEGGSPRWLSYSGERAFNPTISNSQGLVAYEKWQSDMDILQLNLEKPRAPLMDLVPLTSSRGELNPEFSPDGSRLIFVTSRAGSPQIWLAESNGTKARMIIDLGTPMLGPVMWSPDGRSIVYNSRTGGNADIYTYNLETGKKSRITSKPSNDIAPNFSRDGRSVYFGSDRDGSWQLYKKDLGNGDTKKIGKVDFLPLNPWMVNICIPAMPTVMASG